jgi:hypothetical protein
VDIEVSHHTHIAGHENHVRRVGRGNSTLQPYFVAPAMCSSRCHLLVGRGTCCFYGSNVGQPLGSSTTRDAPEAVASSDFASTTPMASSPANLTSFNQMLLRRNSVACARNLTQALVTYSLPDSARFNAQLTFTAREMPDVWHAREISVCQQTIMEIAVRRMESQACVAKENVCR